ncbi:hypothetical protein [Nocardiopsis dassonvillei]|uniref:hypothetical protein n=1 Tax=Nocardiopsis dassonvillei TaxID=2014 RepID=UPI003643BFEB
MNSWTRGHLPAPPPGAEPWSAAPQGQVSAVPMRAYVNHGRWVADCIRPYCGSAEALRPGQSAVWCGNCQLVAPVEWPPDPQGIWDALMVRPVPATRNWFPADHPLAVRHGCPHGQSPAELHDETFDYAHTLVPSPGRAQLEGGTPWRGQLH